ncbi:membrane protein [Lentzea sp. NBRC 105346]|nr:membrane protein [Lentzea sp. NBRC 105346]
MPRILLAVVVAAVALSAVRPYSWFTWLLEVAPILIGVPVLVLTHRRFPLTTLVYVLLAFHCLVLALGAHYTYARVPIGFWGDFDRNWFDRFAHFVQGFVPAMLVREILVRRTPLRAGGWLFTLVTSVCLAVSACYELVEWLGAVLAGGAATDFLGTQGDPWDTQWDMFLALCGAVVAQLILSRRHDRELSDL